MIHERSDLMNMIGRAITNNAVETLISTRSLIFSRNVSW